MGSRRTRSSPVGPAEHDEGGSLDIQLALCDALAANVSMRSQRGCAGHQIGTFVPAKVCELLVDTLQGHCDKRVE